MDAVLGHKPATCPSFVVDTLADRDENNNDDTLFTQELVETDSTDTSEHNTEEQPVSPCKKSKKKKRTKGDQFEVVMSGMVKQLVEAQDRSDVELEEKRMRMEERLMEKEMEMQQQSQRFQLQMMQVMSSMASGASRFIPPMSSSTQYPQFYSPIPPYDDDDPTQVP